MMPGEIIVRLTQYAFLIAAASMFSACATDTATGTSSTGAQNSPPEISAVLSNPNQTTFTWEERAIRPILTAIATDPDGDALSYNWSATGGEFVRAGNAIEDPLTSNPTKFSPIFTGTYTITAIVSDGKATHSESIVFTFEDQPPPVAPILLSPPNGSSVSWPPTLVWDRNGNTALELPYELSASPATIADGAFSNSSISTSSTATSLTLPEGWRTLFPPGTYYWHVRGGDVWSETWSFILIS